MIGHIEAHRAILKHCIFDAQLLLLKSLRVAETQVDSLEGFNRAYMPCLECLCEAFTDRCRGEDNLLVEFKEPRKMNCRSLRQMDILE